MPRLAQGDLVNPTGRRTPLSIAYDVPADQLVRAAIAAQGRWVSRRVQSQVGATLDRGGLTENERAFKQALYYHRLIYRHGRGGWTDEAGHWHQNPNPDRTHALKFRVVGQHGPGGYRNVQVRVHSIGEASLYASEHYG